VNVLREFNVDDVGVPRAQAAQLLANGTGIVWAIEPYLALTISGPPAIPARIPAGGPSIGPGSKCVQYGITHSLPSRFREQVSVLVSFSQNFNTGPYQIVGIAPDRDQKRHSLKGCCAGSARGRGLPRDWRRIGTGTPIGFSGG
jgi:hypothetical protein